MGLYDYLQLRIDSHHTGPDIQHMAQRWCHEHGIHGIVSGETADAWEIQHWVNTLDFWHRVYEVAAPRLNPAVRNWILIQMMSRTHPWERTDI